MTVTDPSTHQQPRTLSAGRRRAVLVVISLALMTVVSAVSGLNVALPALAVDTGASQSQITWIVDAYTVVFAGLLLPAGALGDRYGRRGLLLAGLLVFGAGALGAMLTESPATLIGLRAVMGVGAAAVMPVTLSIITTSFPPDERGRAVGVWVGVAGGGAVLGLFVSGVLLEFFSWGSFFALNVTLVVLAAVGTLWVVPTSREERPPRLDPLGAVLALLSVAGVIFGVIEGPERGWQDPLTLAALATSLVSVVAFVLAEMHNTEPMLDPRLFRLRGFSTGSLSLVLQFFGSYGLFYIVLQYLQYVVGQSPLRSAVSLLPLPLVLIPLARKAPALAARFGTNRVVGTGLAFSAAGLLTLGTLTVELDNGCLALGLVLFGCGMGLAGTPSTTAITASLPPRKQGVGSAVNDTSRELGSALGIAILGTLLTSHYRSGLGRALQNVPPEIAARATSSISFVEVGGQRLTQLGAPGRALADAARRSFADGAANAFLVGGFTLLAAAVAVAAFGPRAVDEGSALTATDDGVLPEAAPGPA